MNRKTEVIENKEVWRKKMSLSYAEISYELGFPYPQHFSRWFKKMVGVTPNEYRQNRNN